MGVELPGQDVETETASELGRLASDVDAGGGAPAAVGDGEQAAHVGTDFEYTRAGTEPVRDEPITLPEAGCGLCLVQPRQFGVAISVIAVAVDDTRQVLGRSEQRPACLAPIHVGRVGLRELVPACTTCARDHARRRSRPVQNDGRRSACGASAGERSAHDTVSTGGGSPVTRSKPFAATRSAMTHAAPMPAPTAIPHESA